MVSYKPNRLIDSYIVALDSPYPLKRGTVNLYDLTTGSITLDMPATPEANDTVIVKQAPGTPTNGNTLTINPNGNDTEIPTLSDTATLTTGTFQLPNLRTSFRWIFLEGTPGTWVCDLSHDPRGGQTVVEAQYTFSGTIAESDGANLTLTERFVYPAGAITGPAPFPPELTIVNAGRYRFAYTMRVKTPTTGDFPQQMPGTQRRQYFRAYIVGTPALVPARAAETETDIIYHVGKEGVSVPLGDEGISNTPGLSGQDQVITGYAIVEVAANQTILFRTDAEYGGQTADLEFSIVGVI